MQSDNNNNNFNLTFIFIENQATEMEILLNNGFYGSFILCGVDNESPDDVRETNINYCLENKKSN